MLIPDKQEIQISDRTYQLGKLSLKQILDLSKLMSKALLGSRQKYQKLLETARQNTSNTADIMSILDLLDNDDVVKFLVIVLGESDASFLNTNIDLAKLLEIVAVLCEYNTFDKANQNFQRIVLAIQKKKKI